MTDLIALKHLADRAAVLSRDRDILSKLAKGMSLSADRPGTTEISVRIENSDVARTINITSKPHHYRGPALISGNEMIALGLKKVLNGLLDAVDKEASEIARKMAEEASR